MVQAVQQVFKRVEKKYLVDSSQFEELMLVLEEHMSKDMYGLHTICNVYFDTKDFELIRTSIEKPVYKEKFRIRSYGVPSDDDTVFLEIKKKCNGVVYKRRIPFKLSEAKKVLDTVEHGDVLYGNVVGGVDAPESEYSVLNDVDNRQIMHEIEYIIKHYGLVPKSYIAYDRIALFGIDEPELRITFDQNVRTRDDNLQLSAGDYGNRLLDEGLYLMEIKTNGAMPLWLARKLSEMEMFPYSFSKYGNAYKRKVMEV